MAAPAAEEAADLHSDRGVQYASDAFRKPLTTHGIAGSMSHVGNCRNNAVDESFIGSLKSARIHWRNDRTRVEVGAVIVADITMFYNSARLHSFVPISPEFG